MHYVLKEELEKILNIPSVDQYQRQWQQHLEKKTIEVVKARGIELKMMLTPEAMKFINETPKDGLVAMLHLNC